MSPYEKYSKVKVITVYNVCRGSESVLRVINARRINHRITTVIEMIVFWNIIYDINTNGKVAYL